MKEETTAIAVTEAQEHALEGYLMDRPYNYDWVVSSAKDAYIKIKQNSFQLGMMLLSLKQQEPHGKFQIALEEIGIPYNTALRYYKRAEFVLASPQKHQLVFLQGGKIDALRKLPDTTLAEITDDDGTILGHSADELTAMDQAAFSDLLVSAREAVESSERQVKDLRHALTDQERLTELQQRRNDELRAQLNPETDSLYPLVVREAREESMLAGKDISLSMDVIERLITRINAPDADYSDGDIGHAEYSIAATTIHANLTAAYAKLCYVMNRFDTLVGEHYRVQQVDDVPPITGDDALRIESRLASLVHAKEAREWARKDQRKSKKGPGRPRGSKAKS